ncbi:MAG: zinc ABC transporter substrate-binding protein [Oligoflexales bacterium]|nr:zinc ABC transporter substrate-binding protein [Oligoflexales bacterium]
MPRNSFVFLILLGTVFASLARASQNKDPQNTDTKNAVTYQTMFSVSISPLAFILEQLLPAEKVFVLVSAGQNPETFQAQPSQLEQLASSKYYFSLGLPIEKKIISYLNNAKEKPQIIELETTSSTQLQSKHNHDHKGLHPWTNPLKMRQYVQAICNTLIKEKIPTETNEFTQRCIKIDEEFKILHNKLKTQLAEYKNQKFLVFHPAWSEFAALYQLEQIAVEHEGKEPSAKLLQDIAILAKQENLKYFYFQPQHSLRTAQTLAKQLSLELVELDPLKYNYFENMNYIARELSEGFKKQRVSKQSKTTLNKLN